MQNVEFSTDIVEQITSNTCTHTHVTYITQNSATINCCKLQLSLNIHTLLNRYSVIVDVIVIM